MEPTPKAKANCAPGLGFELNDQTPCVLDVGKTEGRFVNNYFDGIPVRGIHALLFFIIMAAYFFEQFDNWNFGFAAPAIAQSWGLKPTDIATILFWYFIGMTSGGFLGGVISDFIGRRKTFLISIVIFSVSSVITGFTDNFVIFTIFRALTGFGVFCMMVTSQAYIAEMAPCQTRGMWQGRVAAIGFCAVPVVALVCRMVIPMADEAWRLIFYAGGLGVIPFLLGLKYLKESPRWLVAHGRVKEAEEIVTYLTGKDIDLSEAAKSVQPKISVMEVLTGMFTKKYIGRTLLIMLLFICITPAGFLLTTWTTQLLKMLGFSVKESLTAMTIISIGVPVGCFLNSLVSDMGGRKTPLAILGVLAAVAALVFGGMKSLVMLTLLGFTVTVFNMALNFILFSYTAESYPTRMRNTATGFHNGLARLSVSASQPLIPIIHQAYGFAGIFTSVAVLFFLPIIPLLLWGQRTGGKSLEEIE
ncbi:putative MFS transporter [Desulfoprunum benzoelyticum]|uniref:Putative MFS transporter n=1 Tax=Desulfoprunum benzoelyticum TaxID=1506996 RepID=A0A840UN95_9BACT|nr:MFS transporter [Desulfoprunum benzoelyticum]MBB5346306.1 putative MFS transporter [Desulfoprunum benzoelyticum]